MNFIEVIDAYKIVKSNKDEFFITAILQCDIDGLLQNTILKDTVTQKKWQIDKRISCLSSEPKLKGESEVIFVRWNIRPIEKYFDMLEKVKKREEKGIYEYKLNPLGHEDKPEEGALLTID